MAIEKVLSNCKLSEFANLFLSEKEFHQQRWQWIKEVKLSTIKEAFIPEGGVMATLRKKGLSSPGYLINQTSNSVHAFIGRKEMPSEFVDAILWGKYDGIHILASQQGDNIVLKFVPSMEYYKLRRGIMTISGLFFAVVPGFILLGLFLLSHKEEMDNISSKILPGITEYLAMANQPK